MSKQKLNLGNDKITENKIDPRKRRSLIITIIVWTIIIAIIVGLIVLATLPQTSTIPVAEFRYGNNGLEAAVSNSSGEIRWYKVDIDKSDFATIWLTDTKFLVRMNLNGLGNVYIKGESTSTGNGVIESIVNMQIDKFSGTVTLGKTPGDKPEDTTIEDDNIVNKIISRVGLIQPTNDTANIILQIFSSLLPLIIMILIFYFFYRTMRKNMGGVGDGENAENVFTIGRSQAKLAKSNVRFTDVAGIQEEKNELIEIVDYLKNPSRYAQMGARVPRGVILYGPPGTGKTLLAKAVAGEAGVPFFQITGSAFEDMLVGVGAKRVRDLFTKAKKAAPCIVFIDEIDSVGSKRGRIEVSNYSVAEQTLNQLLAEMDGFNNRTGVVVVAATNRLDVLDDALLRPGRFDRHIQVNLPDVKEREAILKIHASNKNLSAKVSLNDIARRTPGFSGAQLENVLNEATLLAVRANRNAIIMDDLDEAIDRVMAGPAKKSRVLNELDKKVTAYHEAGHALVGLHLKGAEEVQKITIIPRGQAGGYTLSTPKDTEILMKRKSDLLNMVAGALGGRAAEEIVFGPENITSGAANDFYKATNIVRLMVTQLGMSRLGNTQFVPSEGAYNPSVKLYSDKTAQEIDTVINEMIAEQYEVAKKIIRENREEHELLVQALLLQETIVKKDIDYIHKEHKLPPGALEIQKRNNELQKDKIINDTKPVVNNGTTNNIIKDNSDTNRNTSKEN